MKLINKGCMFYISFDQTVFGGNLFAILVNVIENTSVYAIRPSLDFFRK